MKTLHCIETRKSVRSYLTKPVEEEALQTILRAGSLAPVFGQFHITVIQDPALLRQIEQVTLEKMKHSGNDFLEKRAATPGYAPLYGAPVLLLLSAPGGNDANGFSMANVSCAAENMIVQATALELGTCFVMGPMIAFSDPALAQRIALPNGYVPLVGVLAGYPAQALTVNERQALPQITRI